LLNLVNFIQLTDMRTGRMLFFAITGLLLIRCGSGPEKPAAPVMKLVWSDEFDYTGLPDSARWTYDVGGDGWGNNELQFYTSGRSENARVANGILTIEARAEKMENRDYTSARLLTKGRGDWKHARIEVRAKLPRGRGTWPAIWMLASTQPPAWPDDGEIDIMEHVGFAQGIVHATVHTKKYNHVAGTQRGDSVQVKDCSDNFHVYAVEWNAGEMWMEMDSVTYFTFKNDHSGYDAWPFDNPMHLLLNIAVGGNWGGAQGVDTTIWPQRMEVDYVRVYRKE
jgi:beta-glucanase (GH16 family)